MYFVSRSSPVFLVGGYIVFKIALNLKNKRIHIDSPERLAYVWFVHG